MTLIQLTIENYESGIVYSFDDWRELKDEWFTYTSFDFRFVHKKKLLKKESDNET